jgi:hypothetical protein
MRFSSRWTPLYVTGKGSITGEPLATTRVVEARDIDSDLLS